VVFGYSNKAHDGFLGNSVIGEWCNLGADTNNSNLKNNYSSVKIYSMANAEYIDTGLQFCGLMMGDHSKCAINTMFNTGTVVGVNANIFGFGFPAKFIPSFSWDGADEQATFSLAQACAVAAKVFERRSLVFSEVDRKIHEAIFNSTASSRYWEKH
jgi:UDP-N-acetylglucosamine diphosphorylase/glucosamine-1-phosphate N-acetyltransferase